MSLFLQNLLNGLSSGSVYALIALGLVLIYKSSGVVNFAHGSFAMLATFVAYELSQRGAPLLVAFGASLAFAALLGAGAYRALLHRAREGGSHAMVMITIALLMVSEGLAGVIWGSDTKDFHHYFAGSGVFALPGGLFVSHHDAWIDGLTVLLVGLLALFFKLTRVGIALRAASTNETAAALMGVRVARVHALTWGLATVLAAIAGLLLAPRVLLDPSMMFSPLLKAFAAAVLGGLNSVLGAIVGGWLLGVIETLAGAYISTEFQATIGFTIIVLTLSVRPHGLLGRPEVKKV